MSTAGIFQEDGGKARGFLGSMKSLKALKKLKRDQIEDKQSSVLTVERPKSLIDLLSTEICDAYLKLK